MDTKKKKQVECLQENLTPLRRFAGLSMDQLAEEAGVTKMTIQRIEARTTDMSYPQYVTIRMIFERIIQEELENNQKDTLLQKAIPILLDKKDELSEEDYTQTKKAMAIASASVASGITVGLETFMKLLPLTAVPLIGAVAAVTILGDWFKKQSK